MESAVIQKTKETMLKAKGKDADDGEFQERSYLICPWLSLQYHLLNFRSVVSEFTSAL